MDRVFQGYELVPTGLALKLSTIIKHLISGREAIKISKVLLQKQWMFPHFHTNQVYQLFKNYRTHCDWLESSYGALFVLFWGRAEKWCTCTHILITIQPSVASLFLLCCFSCYYFYWQVDLLPSNELDKRGRLIYLREFKSTLLGKQKAPVCTVLKAK